MRVTAPRTRRRVLLALAAVVLLAVGAIGTDYALLSRRIARVHLTFPGSTGGNAGSAWLIIGSDSRSDVPSGAALYGTTAQVPGARADVVLLVSERAGRTTVVSVPRDLLVTDGAGNLDRLTLTRLHGPQTTIDSLCVTLGVPVEHFVEFSMAGFTEMVDAVGGITVDFAQPTRDTLSGFAVQHQGRSRLDGNQTLALVRSRHPEHFVDGRWVATPEAEGAAERSSRAGTVFAAVAKRLDSARLNPWTLNRVAWAASSGLTLDSRTSLSSLRALDSPHSVLDLPTTPFGRGLAVSPTPATKVALAQAGFTTSCSVAPR
jgi:LCP family protein required for cell wall assembly